MLSWCSPSCRRCRSRMSNRSTSARRCCSSPAMPPGTSPASNCASTRAASSRSSRGRRREGLSMARGIIYLETRPVSPDRENEYHKWYNETHLAEICSVDGIVSARRFAPTDGDGPFIAIYELECDDLDAVVDRLGELGRSGKMSSLELLDMQTPPIPK